MTNEFCIDLNLMPYIAIEMQVANIITPNGQIQQVQLAPMNQLQGVQGKFAQINQ